MTKKDLIELLKDRPDELDIYLQTKEGEVLLTRFTIRQTFWTGRHGTGVGPLRVVLGGENIAGKGGCIMRCTQTIGLTPAALKWLEDNCQKEGSNPCPHCKKPTQQRLKYQEIGKVAGMFGDGPTLRKYYPINGGTVSEVVQCTPWSSGPCIFMCLCANGHNSKMFEWTEKEMEKYL